VATDREVAGGAVWALADDAFVTFAGGGAGLENGEIVRLAPDGSVTTVLDAKIGKGISVSSRSGRMAGCSSPTAPATASCSFAMVR
jgi:hypothetical protein